MFSIQWFMTRTESFIFVPNFPYLDPNANNCFEKTLKNGQGYRSSPQVAVDQHNAMLE